MTDISVVNCIPPEDDDDHQPPGYQMEEEDPVAQVQQKLAHTTTKGAEYNDGTDQPPSLSDTLQAGDLQFNFDRDEEDKVQGRAATGVKPEMRCSFKRCMRLLGVPGASGISQKFFHITETTIAGGKDWSSLLGMTLCKACYVRFSRTGSLAGAGGTPVRARRRIAHSHNHTPQEALHRGMAGTGQLLNEHVQQGGEVQVATSTPVDVSAATESDSSSAGEEGFLLALEAFIHAGPSTLTLNVNKFIKNRHEVPGRTRTVGGAGTG